MNENQHQQENVAGRSINVGAHGPDMDGVELSALDQAREFFGAGARLEVVRDYKVFAWGHEPSEKRYHASVTVREIT